MNAVATFINAPGVPAASAGSCHAVRAGRLTWIGAIYGAAADIRCDAIAEMERALAHLRLVLDAAGLDRDDLVRVNAYYAPQHIDSAALAACQKMLAVTVGAGTCAGASAMFAPAAKGARLAIEAVAADRGAKLALPATAARDSGPWAVATRVGSTIFVSGVVPERAVQDEPPKRLPETGGASGFFAHSHSAYRNLARAVDAVHSAWPECRGLGDVVRTHQHITRPDIDLADFRRSRVDLLHTGDFVSTSVLAAANDPDRVGRDPWIKIDAELAVGARRRVSVPGVWANPGGLHALLSDELAFFQAQMGRDATGTSVHADDPERHAEQVFANIDGMLAGANLEWNSVVYARIYCKNHDQVAPAERRLHARMGAHACAATCLIAGFFDPRALLEIEITAAL